TWPSMKAPGVPLLVAMMNWSTGKLLPGSTVSDFDPVPTASELVELAIAVPAALVACVAASCAANTAALMRSMSSSTASCAALAASFALAAAAAALAAASAAEAAASAVSAPMLPNGVKLVSPTGEPVNGEELGEPAPPETVRMCAPETEVLSIS